MITGKPLIDDINDCQVPPGCCAIWWLGQHGFVLKLGKTVLYLDAFLSAYPGRLVEPLLRPGEVTNADLVLGTHDHADHIDRDAWPGIAAASPNAIFIVPELARRGLCNDLAIPPERMVGLDDGRSFQHGELTISAIPAAHEFLGRDEATGMYPYLGYIVQGNGCTVYHAGDTCIYEGMQGLLRQWKLDVAILPINGRDAKRLAANCIGNMTYQEAVDLAGAIAPALTLPAHFDMFEGNRENPQQFIEYMRIKYPHLRTHLPEHGRRFLYRKS